MREARSPKSLRKHTSTARGLALSSRKMSENIVTYLEIDRKLKILRYTSLVESLEQTGLLLI